MKIIVAILALLIPSILILGLLIALIYPNRDEINNEDEEDIS